MPRDYWTDERVALLQRFARERKSYDDAARALGITRSSVAGKAQRAGIVFACAPERRSRKHSVAAKHAWDKLTPEARRQRLRATCKRGLLSQGKVTEDWLE